MMTKINSIFFSQDEFKQFSVCAWVYKFNENEKGYFFSYGFDDAVEADHILIGEANG